MLISSTNAFRIGLKSISQYYLRFAFTRVNMFECKDNEMK